MTNPSSTVEDYQRVVRRLTAEKDAAERSFAEERAAWQAERRRLAAEAREGVTVELVEVRRQLSAWRQRALAAEARLREERARGTR